MEEKNNFENLIEDAKGYLDTRIDLAKLQTIEKTSAVAGSAAVAVLLLLFFSMVFLFSSVALAFYISEITGRYTTGFLCVGGINLLIGLIIYLARESWINKPVTNLIIAQLLKKDDE
ncbi:MAG: phage holin family protein [Bacteroidetes bacterium]|nr:phage holin family protein [Bacteroidota bacterium]